MCPPDVIANASKLDAEMRKFCASGGPDDVRLIYFTGHGILADGATAASGALFAMVANRACAPTSKLYCYEQWLGKDVRIEGTETLALHHLYRAMDFLEQHKDAIEQAVYFRMADLLNVDVELIFYYTTSLPFEIDDEDVGAAGEDTVRGSMAAGARRYREQVLRELAAELDSLR